MKADGSSAGRPSVEVGEEGTTSLTGVGVSRVEGPSSLAIGSASGRGSAAVEEEGEVDDVSASPGAGWVGAAGLVLRRGKVDKTSSPRAETDMCFGTLEICEVGIMSGTFLSLLVQRKKDNWKDETYVDGPAPLLLFLRLSPRSKHPLPRLALPHRSLFGRLRLIHGQSRLLLSLLENPLIPP